MAREAITDQELAQYNNDGYVLVKGMFAPDEIEMLGKAAREDRVLN